MTDIFDRRAGQLLDLANLYCEQQLTAAQTEQLNELLRSDPTLLSLFTEFLQLHGQLLWDAGLPVGASDPLLPTPRSATRPPVPAALAAVRPRHQAVSSEPRRTRSWISAALVACSLLAGAAAVYRLTMARPPQLAETARLPEAVDTTDGRSERAAADDSGTTLAAAAADAHPQAASTPPHALPSTVQPLTLRGLQQPAPATTTVTAAESAAPTDASTAVAATGPVQDEEVISGINQLLAAVWEENIAEPAAPATDSEWVRRVYLTLAGRIPSVEESVEFLQHAPTTTADRFRRQLVQQLLQDERTSEHLAVMWINLLIGRSNPRNVDADALLAFLQDRFLRNQPWIDTVGELIAAEGRSDQNGATNFLLAHLNDQATPATAVTARLFLGMQVHCTQCHDHPFARDVRQEQFWALNAFFKQTVRQPITVSLPDGKQKRVWDLQDSPRGGMTFYETLRGQQKAVLPEFAGGRLTAEDGVQRRSQLVQFLKSDPQQHVAQAMVNRMWHHFFGAGFTTPVDDMGPHNPPAHPELLSFLTSAYVRSGYDTRRLMLWIALSDAWQLSSGDPEAESAAEFGPLADEPIPLFTHVSARQMLPEQVYDSIRVAIRSVSRQPIDSSLGSVHRREWVQQFVESYGTDENDERLQFDGNISQALLMMNGEDLEQAIPQAVRAMLNPESGSRPSVAQCLERVAMAVVSRKPTPDEERAFRQRYRTLSRSMSSDQAQAVALEDLLWAYLNSSEFMAVH